MKKTLIALLTASMVISPALSAGAQEEHEPVVFGFTVTTNNNPFFAEIEAAVRSMVEENGDVLITSDPQSDLQTQISQCDYLHSSGINPNKTLSWKQDRKAGGGGVLLDLGAHAYDVMYYLLGEYDRLYTVTDTVYAQRPGKDGALVNVDAEDTALTLARMKNGAPGKILVSKVATGTMDELRINIHGEKGAIRFNTMDPGYLEFYDATQPEQPLGGNAGFTRIDCHQKYPEPGGHFPNPRFAIGFLRAHAASMYNFLEHVHNGETSSPSFAESAYIQNVMERCYESAQRGEWVTV